MNISFRELKRLLKESVDNHFKVGCKYTWWSRNWNWTGGSFVVVDIAPDRSYIQEVSLDGNDKAAYKYKIIGDGNGGEKISDHPAPYAWRVARADRGGEFVGVPDGWYSQETKNRKEGASKASTTRRIKSTLKKIASNVTKEHFYKLVAARFKGGADAWPEIEKIYQEKGLDGEIDIDPNYTFNCRGPKSAKGKNMYLIRINLDKGGHVTELAYDGEKFYADWDYYKGYDGIPDEEIREILSDIL